MFFYWFGDWWILLVKFGIKYCFIYIEIKYLFYYIIFIIFYIIKYIVFERILLCFSVY